MLGGNFTRTWVSRFYYLQYVSLFTIRKPSFKANTGIDQAAC